MFILFHLHGQVGQVLKKVGRQPRLGCRLHCAAGSATVGVERFVRASDDTDVELMSIPADLRAPQLQLTGTNISYSTALDTTSNFFFFSGS